MQVGEIEPPDCGRREPVTHIRRYWRALRRGMWNERHLDFRQLELKAVGVAGRLFCSALQYCFNEVSRDQSLEACGGLALASYAI
jgi:hypothetical protein